MKLYPVYFALATFTVFSPGPGVVMTLTNSLRFGLRGAFGGILGISFGALVIAAVSATGLGLLLVGSAGLFPILKCIGACYLAFLGFKLWRAPGLTFTDPGAREAGFGQNFLRGMTLQFSNPKAIFFFLSVLPQFIDRQMGFAWQFALMAATYGLLIIAVHSLYALGAQRSRGFLVSAAGGRAVNRVGGTLFIVFALLLAWPAS